MDLKGRKIETKAESAFNFMARCRGGGGGRPLEGTFQVPVYAGGDMDAGTRKHSMAELPVDLSAMCGTEGGLGGILAAAPAAVRGRYPLSSYKGPSFAEDGRSPVTVSAFRNIDASRPEDLVSMRAEIDGGWLGRAQMTARNEARALAGRSYDADGDARLAMSLSGSCLPGDADGMAAVFGRHAAAAYLMNSDPGDPSAAMPQDGAVAMAAGAASRILDGYISDCASEGAGGKIPGTVPLGKLGLRLEQDGDGAPVLVPDDWDRIREARAEGLYGKFSEGLRARTEAEAAALAGNGFQDAAGMLDRASFSIQSPSGGNGPVRIGAAYSDRFPPEGVLRSNLVAMGGLEPDGAYSREILDNAMKLAEARPASQAPAGPKPGSPAAMLAEAVSASDRRQGPSGQGRTYGG